MVSITNTDKQIKTLIDSRGFDQKNMSLLAQYIVELEIVKSKLIQLYTDLSISMEVNE